VNICLNDKYLEYHIDEEPVSSSPAGGAERTVFGNPRGNKNKNILMFFLIFIIF